MRFAPRARAASHRQVADRGLSDFDVRHLVTANYDINLPFGSGQPFFGRTGGIVDRIIGGFKLNGTVHYNTSLPFTEEALDVTRATVRPAEPTACSYSGAVHNSVWYSIQPADSSRSSSKPSTSS